MNRLWLSVLLLIGLLTFCFFTAKNISALTLNVEQLLYEADRCAQGGNFINALKCTNAAEKIWDKEKSAMGALLRHDEADLVEAGFMRLRAYAKTRDTDEFLAVCAEIMHHLRHIRSMERPLLENIM